jgi:hypothetical protein
MRNICLYYMSAEVPPDPILTTYQYWNWLNVDAETRRQRALDNTYMMFPTVQNKPTTFSKMFVELITLITQIASTFTVDDRIINLLFAANTWTSLNTFGSIDTDSITTNTITATTLALSGTQLDTPMTTNRTYPITPFAPPNSTINYGTAGTIGYTIVSSSNGAFTQTGTYTDINKVQVVRFTNTVISVPPGIWILQLEIQTSVIYGFAIGLSFGTTPIPTTDDRTVTTKKPGMFGCKYTPWNQAGLNNVIVKSGNSTLTHYSNTTGSNITIYGFLYIGGYGLGIDRATMTAVKIG